MVFSIGDIVPLVSDVSMTNFWTDFILSVSSKAGQDFPEGFGINVTLHKMAAKVGDVGDVLLIGVSENLSKV